MKKNLILLLIAGCFSYTAMAQFSLENIFGSSQTQTDDKGKSTLQDVMNSIGEKTSSATSEGSSEDLTSVLGDILSSAVAANQELTVADLQGNWVYVKPACKFKSSNFLKSAGGDVVSSQVSAKLTSFYTRLGFTASTYSVDFASNGDFKMKYKKVPLSGSATRATEKGYFTFKFVKLGSYSLAQTPVYIEVVGDRMLLLFEVDKFVDLFKSVVDKLGISTLDKIFALADGYEGILIGFEMERK